MHFDKNHFSVVFSIHSSPLRAMGGHLQEGSVSSSRLRLRGSPSPLLVDAGGADRPRDGRRRLSTTSIDSKITVRSCLQTRFSDIKDRAKFEELLALRLFERVDKGVKPKAPQILQCLLDLKPCFVSMSVRLFFTIIYIMSLRTVLKTLETQLVPNRRYRT